MSATTPDAWKELCLLLETRKQALDNALLRTLDDKCPASYFQVARSLMLDHEKMLHWFMSQHKQEPVTTTSTITKPITTTSSMPGKRAGWIKPGLLALLGCIFFFLVLLLAILQGNSPVAPNSGLDRQGEAPAVLLGTMEGCPSVMPFSEQPFDTDASYRNACLRHSSAIDASSSRCRASRFSLASSCMASSCSAWSMVIKMISTA